MKTIKIIDLLNKIAKGEEVPKKIKLNEIIFECQGDDYLFIDKDNTNYWLFSEPYSDKFEYLENFLKSEVEIIEEENKIPEKINVKGSYNSNKGYEDFNDNEKILVDKINEIIDYLKSKEKGE